MRFFRISRRPYFWRVRALACCGFVFAFISGAARAQQAQPDTYTGFDGQKISAVEIAAGPDVDTVALRSLVQLQSGQPFSDAAMRQGVAALQQTHRFKQVQVSLQPDAQGLRVLFILQPALYVGILRFPGTGRPFSYPALLQAANIPEQSPYFADLLTTGRRGLLDYFQKQGYFEAEVEPEIETDAPHRIVNVIFRCTMRQRARVRDIDFTGLSPEQIVSTRTALRGLWARLKKVSLKPGEKYSEPHIAKSIDFIRDHLCDEGQLAPSVKLTSKNYDPSTHQVDITFGVVPGPKVFVKVAGAHVSNKTIRKLVPIYEEGSVDQDLIDEGQRNLTAYFQTKGYFDARTDSHVDKQNDVINIVYEVSRGPRHHEKGVYFDGNHYFSDSELKQHVYIKKGFFFLHGTYSEQLLKKSVTSLTQLYKDQGFQNVSVEPKVEDFNPEVDVAFEITEGTQDKVGTLQVVGNKTQPVASLTKRHPLHLKPGATFSPKIMEADRSRLLAGYLDHGYQNAAVRAAATPSPDDPHKIDVTFTVQEGPEANITQVVLLGNQHTSRKFVDQIIDKQIKPGQPLSEGHFLQSESDLYDLGIFDWASVKPLRPIVDQTGEEVLVKLHESALNTMDIGGGIEIIPRDGNIPVNAVAVPGIPPISLGNKFEVSQKSYVGPRFTFDYARHDILGRAQTATIGTVLSRLDQRVFFTYADPHLHGSSWSSLLSVSAERTTQNPIYTAELGQASLQIEKSLDKKRTQHLIGRYSFERTDLYNILIPNLVLPRDQHVRLSTFDAEYVRDTRDKPLDAHKGIYQTFDFGVTAKALGASEGFLRFLGQTAFYKQMTPWLVWANNFRLGFASPFNGSDVPLSERFFTGGADSLRGFPINGAGPQRPLPVCTNPADQSTCTLISIPVGGDMLFIVNSEARFPLPIKSGLGGVFFYDGGNAYSNISLREFGANFTHSVGVGIRYQTPVGPIRFDVGYRLTTVPGINTVQYFVTLGQSF